MLCRSNFHGLGSVHGPWVQRRRPPGGPAAGWHLPGASAALAAGGCLLRRADRADRGKRRAVPLAELLGPELAADWSGSLEVEGMQVVAADLMDLERCMGLVAPVFNVKMDDPGEVESVKKGIAGRLGARRSLVGRDAASPRPRLARPAPHGSTERPELGLVIALQRNADFVALVDLSLWPDDGRVRAPGATSKPGVPSKPYILNLCVEPDFRRQGLARRLMKVSERLIRDVWGDTEIYLHVEDDQVAANYLYEKIGYVPLKYTYDKECPYTKAEAKVLRTVTWRRKFLDAAAEGSPARSGTLLPEVAEALEKDEPVESLDDDDDEDEEDEDEDEEEEEEEEEVIGAILLWVLTIVCVVITTGSVVAVKECRDYCGLGCVAHGFPVACDGKAEGCFVDCDRGFEEFDKEEECIASEKCEDAAKDEQRIAEACEKQQACDEKGFLGTGPRFVLMLAIVSILPVASTLCMGLYKEAFRWDDSVWEKLNFYDGFGRVVLVIGACLTIYVSYLLLETYINGRRKGAGFIGAVVSLFALMVNCGACFLLALARWCMSKNGYSRLAR
ncbi:unnamed protein product [Cladocopium goreaui]|uniref:N-acetyltransferase domain-containing protein n=1 Tax=Cladocopium goreaui TaxID=2562237 RepID=A0A9P1D4F5_9DINO|nr:unnamed protein product [Cladocopium goreaui]